MKFEEYENSFTFPNIQTPIIYFLINGDEVVYVGQSGNGLTRPYQHFNKDFDKVSVLKCQKHELDYLETKYIQKYKPKYNKWIINSYSLSVKNAKNKIRENTFFKEFTLNDMKWIVRKIGIEMDSFNGVFYIKSSDVDKIMDFLNENKNIILNKPYSWKNILE